MFYDLEPYDTLYNDQYDDLYNKEAFDKFKISHPTYLEDLNNRINDLYSIYTLICNEHFSQIGQDDKYNETVSRFGWGMLLRHALEVISIDILFKCGIPAGGMTVFDRLDKLNGQIVSGYDKQEDKTLHQALDMTNEIAHPHLIGSSSSSNDLYAFYRDQFRDVIEDHIQQTSRKDVRKYLSVLTKDLDNFNIKNKTTYNLISGCLVRHLAECIVNLWGYSNNLIPTDASTFENQIGLSSVLSKLDKISKDNNTGFGTSPLTQKVISALFDLKNVSNSMMHVTPDNIKIENIEELGKQSRWLHPKITLECAPYPLNPKHNNVKYTQVTSDTPSLVSTLLCGLGGWLGIHHFYAGNIGKGILFLLTCGFMIGPLVSLNNLRTGNFNTKKWGKLPKTRLTTILSVFFMLLHIGLLYLIYFHP